MRIERTVVSKEVVAPDLADQPVTREGDAAVAHHEKQQVILLGRQLHLRPVDGHLAGGKVHQHVFDADSFVNVFCGTGSLCTAEHRAHAHHQLPWRKGLDHIIVHTQFKAMDAVVFLAPCGKENDGYVAGLSNFPGSRKAVQLRHHDVHDDQVIAARARHFHGLHPVLRLRHLIAIKHGVLGNQLTDHFFIVHDQQLHPSSTPFPSS